LFYSLYLSYIQIADLKEIKKFDPYEILEVEPSSDLKVIKKAYR
jgi:preprotein translocase subunit Sec63